MKTMLSAGKPVLSRIRSLVRSIFHVHRPDFFGVAPVRPGRGLARPGAYELEAIEPRLLMDATVDTAPEPQLLLSGGVEVASVVLSQGVLNATLTGANDKVVVQQTGGSANSGYTVKVTIRGLAGTADVENIYSGVSSIVLDGQGGDDRFRLVGVQAGVEIQGGEGTDTLEGDDTDNTWRLAGADAGVLNGKVSFSGIENLTGGDADDVFAFDDQATLTGVLDGGAGANALDFSAYQTAVVVNLASDTATGTGGAKNFSDLVGGAGIDTLVGVAADSIWRITESNTGEITDRLAFAGIENLTGTAGARDRFVVEADGSLSGTLDGGAGGLDTLVVANAEDDTYTQVNARAGGANSSLLLHGKTLAYAGLEPVMGLTVGGSGAVSILIQGSPLQDAWTLADDADQVAHPGVIVLTTRGADFYDDALYGDATQARGFTDTLGLTLPLTPGPTSILIELDQGADSLRLGAVAAPAAAAAAAGLSITVNAGAGLDALEGSAGADHRWTLNTLDAGVVDGYGAQATVAFSGVEWLTGGDENDTFVYAGDAAAISVVLDELTGETRDRIGISGGSGGFDTADFSAVTDPGGVVVAAGSDSPGIDRFIGSQGSDTLVGAEGDRDWALAGLNAGVLTGALHFEALLDDGTSINASNQLVFAGKHHLLNGEQVTYRTDRALDSAGSDGSGLAAGTTYFVKVITGTNGTTVELYTGYTVSETGGVFTGAVTLGTAGWSASGGSALQGEYLLSSVAFEGFENLESGVGDDRFMFAEGATLGGALRAGGGFNTLDYSAHTAADAVFVNLGAGPSTGVAGGVFDIDAVIGGSGSADTLRGFDLDANWRITGANQGSLSNGNRSVAFAGFENLKGADDNQDAFTLAAGGSLSGAIDAGARGFDGLAIENPVLVGDVVQRAVILSDATGAGTIAAGAVFDGTSGLSFSGLEPAFLADTSTAGVLRFTGTAFDDQLSLSQATDGALTLSSAGDVSTLYWDQVAGAFTDNAIASALPPGTLRIELSGGDTLSIGALDTQGSDLVVNLSGNATHTFTADVYTRGGDIDITAGGSTDNDGFRNDKGSIIVNAGVLLSTRQTAPLDGVSEEAGASVGDSGDIRFLSGHIEIGDGALLLSHDTRSAADDGVPAGIKVQSSPDRLWTAGQVYRDHYTTGGSGTGLRVDIYTDADGNPHVVLRERGSGYVDGDLITVKEPGSFAVGSQVTFQVDGLLAHRGGDISLTARYNMFGAWYFGSDIKADVVIGDDAVLMGRDVVVRASANNSVIFNDVPAEKSPGTIEEMFGSGASDYWTGVGQSLATGLSELVMNFSVFVGYQVQKAVANDGGRGRPDHRRRRLRGARRPGRLRCQFHHRQPLVRHHLPALGCARHGHRGRECGGRGPAG
jgi:hypothetical protein